MRQFSFRLAALTLLVAACTPASTPPFPDVVSKGSLAPQGLDASISESTPVFAIPARGLARPNGQIAQDFLDLEFRMESGQILPALTRFEGPITWRLTGAVPVSAPAEMAALVGRLRAEAGLDLSPARMQADAHITIEFAPRATLKRLEPGAACFVAPNVASLADFRRLRGSAALSWQEFQTRDKVAVFIPSDISPQEQRDCLHEEVAQALGPLNDLFRLPDSVFNDDNFQSVLSEFDMLVLRLHYAPELRSGMGRSEVAARLPGLLAALNPGGQVAGGWAAPDTPRAWTQAVAAALGGQGSGGSRLAAARNMVTIAQDHGWTDNRLGFSWFILGRLQAPQDPQAAEAAFLAAARVYATLPDGGTHLSHALMQLAAVALATGRPERAMALAGQALPLAEQAQNSALVASLKMITAEALELTGRAAEAQALRLDLAPVARYGFGSAVAVRARAAEMAGLARRG